MAGNKGKLSAERSYHALLRFFHRPKRFVVSGMPPEEDQENIGSRAPRVLSVLQGPRIRQSSLSEVGALEFIGQGAFGKVFKFHNTKTGKVYALKEIKTPVTKEGVPQHVLREVAILKDMSKYNCPNLLKLHSVTHHVIGREQLIVKMVVDFCEWDLHDFLKRIPRTLPASQVKMLVSQLFCGIGFLHSHNVIHRDLKPQNILVSKDQTLKIADFGLSKYVSTTSAFTPLVVTLWYRAPEILLQSNYDHASDMWSIGCIIHEIITREPLFPGQNEAEQLHMILKRIGSPTERDWPKDSVVKLSSFPKYKTQYEFVFGSRDFHSLYCLIKSLLVFAPAKRATSDFLNRENFQ